MNIIKSDTAIEAWLAAVNHLSSDLCPENWEFNLIVEIASPGAVTSKDKKILRHFDLFLKDKGMSVENVAETIFPAGIYIKYGLKGMFKKYIELYPAIKQHKSNKWGTYAHRLMCRTKLDNKTVINPLDLCIAKINRHWNTDNGSQGRGAYEINIIDENLDLPIYRSESDNGYYPGGPCLSHISLKVSPDRKLHMTVLYRSHFYMEKALGNFLGLARLQQCICTETKLEAGPILCVSTYARLDVGKHWSKRKALELIASLNKVKK